MLQAYLDGKGSIQYIMDHIMVSTFEDESRFIELLNKAIEEGKVEQFPRWKRDTSDSSIKKRRKAAEKEAEEAEQLSKELGHGKRVDKMGEAELGKMIMQRQQGRMERLLDKLETEASKGGKKGKRKEATDEEFEEARARLEKRKKRSKGI